MYKVVTTCLCVLLLAMLQSAKAENLPMVMSQQVIKADFEQPTAIAVDQQDRLWVVDGGNSRIAVLNAAGQWLFNVAQGDQGLNLPMDIAIAGERVAVADSGNKRLLLFDLQGKPLQAIVPTWIPQAKREYLPSRPVAVFIQNDTLYWSDQANHQICYQDLSAADGSKAQCFGQRGETEEDFQYPFQFASDSAGYLHVVDVINARIKVLHRTGKVFSQISRFGVNADELFRPNGIAIDDQDVVYIADNYYGTISMFQHGHFIGKLKNQQGNPLQFNSPVGLHWHKQQLYVVDSLGNSVVRLSLVNTG